MYIPLKSPGIFTCWDGNPQVCRWLKLEGLVHVACVLRGYGWHHTPCCTSVYIVPHVCICTPYAPDEDETTVVHLSNEDLVNDYEDYSGEPTQMTSMHCLWRLAGGQIYSLLAHDPVCCNLIMHWWRQKDAAKFRRNVALHCSLRLTPQS